MVLNRLTTELAKVCRERRTEETWLLAPSYRIGNRWLDAVATAGAPVLNVRVKTLTGLAMDLAGPEMARLGLEFLPRRGAEVVVDDLWQRRRKTAGRKGYLSRLDPSPSMAAAMVRTIDDLRMAEVPPGRLSKRGPAPGGLDTGEKRTEIDELLAAFSEKLRGSLIDRAGILQLALRALGDEQGNLPRGLLILIPGDLPADGIAGRFLDALPEKRILPVDAPVEPAADAPISNARLLAFTGSPEDAPPRAHDGTVAFYAAAGEGFEVREALRRCLAANWPLDTVELLHTDADEYIPCIWEEVVRLFPRSPDGTSDESFGTFGYPVTFEEGIPLLFSRPGKALSLWASWVVYRGQAGPSQPQDLVTAMIRERLLIIDGVHPTEHQRLAGLFRSLPIGWGAERYVPAVEVEIGRARWKLARETGEDAEGDGGANREATRRRLADLVSLRRLATALLGSMPNAAASTIEVLRKGRDFIERLAPGASGSIDGFAKRRILDELDALIRWEALAEGGSGAGSSPALLEGLARDLRMGGSGPRPGCLHVSPFPDGGHSGRDHFFLLGLDDGRFPGSGRQDPLLLDHERIHVASGLATSATRMQRRILGAERLLARLRGTVTMSFPDRSFEDDRDRAPANLMLQAYRVVVGKPGDTLGDLLRFIGPSASFAPESPPRCLDESEWWLLAMNQPGGLAESGGLVRARYPHLGHGAEATAARDSDIAGPYDGIVPPDPAFDLTGPDAPTVSASRLEQAGGCPLSYFFRYVLELVRPEDLPWDPSAWLDKAEEGELLHEVFRLFGERFLEPESAPEPERDREILEAILAERIDAMRKRKPEPGEEILGMTRRRLERAARVFFGDFLRRWGRSRPIWLESTIGWPSRREGGLASGTPVSYPLPGGRFLRIGGKIDRVDRLVLDGSPPLFVVWDYKTGRAHGRGKDPFEQGRRIQSTLYLRLAGEQVRRMGDAHARVTGFGYLYLGANGGGSEVAWEEADLAGGPGVVADLCDLIAGGAFLPTERKEGDACLYCDYMPICDAAGYYSRGRARRKLDAAANGCLAPHRRLRSKR